MPDHSCGTIFFPSAQSDPFLVQLCAVPTLLTIDAQEQSLAPPAASLPQGAAESDDDTPYPSLLKADQPGWTQPLITGHAFQL